MKLYKPSEVLKLIGVSKITLIRWEQSGKLIAKRYPSGRKFYTQEQVDKLLKGEK
jgi:predicted site-specific integrase-resolvase